MHTRGRVRPNEPTYSAILATEAATSPSENSSTNRHSSRVDSGARPALLPEAAVIPHTSSRSIVHTAAISKKPRRAYSATVNAFGRIPANALLK